MTLTLILLAGILGAAIGSFLNVVLYRYGALSISKGRSMCLTCGTTLCKRDLIPVLSFLLLKGKCRSCSAKIDRQYILVELATGILTALAAYMFLGSELTQTSIALFFVLAFAIIPLLVLIFVYDMKHQIIPDRWSYSFAVAALVFQALMAGGIPHISVILAGLLLALPTFFLHFFSKGAWMGLGDVKLFLGVGFFLGPIFALSGFMLSFWIGAVVSLAIMFLDTRSNLSWGSKVPFGPFIIIATLVVFFTQIDIARVADILALFSH